MACGSKRPSAPCTAARMPAINASSCVRSSSHASPHRLHRVEQPVGALAGVEQEVHRLVRIGHQLERIVVARRDHGALLGAELLAHLGARQKQHHDSLDGRAQDRAAVAQHPLALGGRQLLVRQTGAFEHQPQRIGHSAAAPAPAPARHASAG